MTTTEYTNAAKIAVTCVETMHTIAAGWYKAYDFHPGKDGAFEFMVDLPLFGGYTETVVVACNSADDEVSEYSAFNCTVAARDGVCYDLSAKILLDDELAYFVDSLLEPLYCIFGHNNVAVI